MRLNKVDLSDQFLEYTLLHGAKLSCANLIRANLIRTNLIAANLSDTNLFDANLSRANLSNVKINDRTNANLTYPSSFVKDITTIGKESTEKSSSLDTKDRSIK